MLQSRSASEPSSTGGLGCGVVSFVSRCLSVCSILWPPRYCTLYTPHIHIFIKVFHLPVPTYRCASPSLLSRLPSLPLPAQSLSFLRSICIRLLLLLLLLLLRSCARWLVIAIRHAHSSLSHYERPNPSFWPQSSHRPPPSLPAGPRVDLLLSYLTAVSLVRSPHSYGRFLSLLVLVSSFLCLFHLVIVPFVSLSPSLSLTLSLCGCLEHMKRIERI